MKKVLIFCLLSISSTAFAEVIYDGEVFSSQVTVSDNGATKTYNIDPEAMKDSHIMMNDAVNVLGMGMQLLCLGPSIGTLEEDLRLRAHLKERYKSVGAPVEAVVIIPAGYAVYSDCDGKNSKTLSSISIRAYKPREPIKVEFTPSSSALSKASSHQDDSLGDALRAE